MMCSKLELLRVHMLAARSNSTKYRRRMLLDVALLPNHSTDPEHLLYTCLFII